MATKKRTKKKATAKKATTARTGQDDKALAAYLKQPNYTKLAKRFNMSPMGFRARVLRAAQRRGVDLGKAVKEQGGDQCPTRD